MKKLLLLCLVLTIAAGGATSAQAGMAVTAVDVCAAIDELHTSHQAMHEMLSMTLDQDGEKLDCFFPAEAADTYMGCLEVYIPTPQALPTDAGSIYQLFLTMLYTSSAITASVDDVHLVDLARIEEDLESGSAQISIPPQTWWASGFNDEMEMLVVPVLLLDGSKTVMDDAVYMFVMYTTEALTGLWVCADQDISRQMLETLITPPTDITDETAYLRDWLYSMPAVEEPTPTAPPVEETSTVKHSLVIGSDGVQAQDTAPPEDEVMVEHIPAGVIGIATVTHAQRINLRAGDTIESKSLGHAYPGDALQCIGITDAGWYEVLFEGGTAFVGASLVEYEPVATE